MLDLFVVRLKVTALWNATEPRQTLSEFGAPANFFLLVFNVFYPCFLSVNFRCFLAICIYFYQGSISIPPLTSIIFVF